jgi:hypothetical protein
MKNFKMIILILLWALCIGWVFWKGLIIGAVLTPLPGLQILCAFSVLILVCAFVFGLTTFFDWLTKDLFKKDKKDGGE